MRYSCGRSLVKFNATRTCACVRARETRAIYPSRFFRIHTRRLIGVRARENARFNASRERISESRCKSAKELRGHAGVTRKRDASELSRIDKSWRAGSTGKKTPGIVIRAAGRVAIP